MMYPVVETFQSIQGEGRFTGYPANFIRLAGCPNLCKFCDTDLVEHEKCSETTLAYRVNYQLPLTVITGGEPCIHNLLPLVQEIRKEDSKHLISVETSGVRSLPLVFDWITLSPKNSKVRRSVFQAADEIKWLYPMYTVDKIWSIVRVWGTKFGCMHWLQPINYKKRLNPVNVKGAIKELMNNQTPLQIRLGIQLHKVLKVR